MSLQTGLLAAAGAPAPQAVVSSASFQPTVAPGSLASLFGQELSPRTVVGSLDDDGSLPTSLAGVTVLVEGRPAQLVFVSPAQINFLVPAQTSLGRVAVAVLREDGEQNPTPQLFIRVDAVAPAIFHAGLLHPNRASAIDAVTFEAGPIMTGNADATYVSLYGTGIRGSGSVFVELIDRTGHVTAAEADYAGPAPGLLGLDQVNFAVPEGLAGAGVLELRLRVGNLVSNIVSLDLTGHPEPSYAPGEYRIEAYAGTGAPGRQGDGGSALNALLQRPLDVELLRDGSLLIADTGNRVIRRVSVRGQITAFAGTGEDGSGGNGGLAVDASFRMPAAIAADARGNVYVADSGDHRVRRIDVHGVITAFAGVGVAGFGGDGGTAKAAMLSAPSGVAVNALGSVVIADTGNNRIRLVTSDAMIQTIAGSGEAGDTGDGDPAVNARLHAPTSVAVSRLNAIFVADSGNRKIRRIDANGLIHTVISLDDEETAQTVASLSIALDAVEQLLFSNEIEHDFSALTLDNLVRPVAGRGEPGFAGDGGPAIEASLHAPGGSVSNVFSDIFLADTENHNVRLLWRKLGDPDAPCGQVVAIGFLPSVAISGEKLIGYVRLNCPIDEEVTVILGSGAPEIPVPPSVTIPPGSIVGVFEVDTPAVDTPTVTDVTGKDGNGGEVGGPVIVLPGNPGIRSLTITAESVVGGRPVTGQIWLGAPAPAGGLVVELTSSVSAASVVASVTVPEGAISAEFLIGTTPVDKPIVAMINGKTGDLSASGRLLILPVSTGSTHRLVSLSLDAISLLGGASATAIVTANEPAPAGGLEVFISSSTPMLTAPLTVTIPEGQTSATFQVKTLQVAARLLATLFATCNNTVRATLTIDIEAGPGSADLSSLTLAPSTVAGGQTSIGTVQLTGPAADGGVLVSLASNNAAATVPGSIVIPKGQTSGQFTVTTTQPGSQQTATIAATSANSASAALTIDPLGPARADIASVSLSPNPVMGGQSSDGTVALVGPAPAGGVLVAFGSSNANAVPPASILIPAGQTTASFVVGTVPVGSQETAQITATSANSVSTALTIDPTSAGLGQLSGLTLTPSTVNGGQSASGTVTLAAPAPPAGVLVNLSSGDPNASTPGAIVVPGGQATAQFTVTTTAVAAQALAQITAASANAVSATLTIQIPPPGQGQIGGLTLVPATVNGGQSSTGSVILTAAAPVGGILVNLSSGSPNATVPASIVIPSGQSSGQFQIATSTVSARTLAQITAASANSADATLTIDTLARCVSDLALNASITDLLSGNGLLSASVTLDGPAPQGGVQVSLVRGGVNMGLVVVPEGQTAASTDLTIANLLSILGSNVQAVLNGCQAVQATINLASPVNGTIAGLTLSPSTVDGGQSSTGTVTLASPAGSNGVLVNVSSGNVKASVPAKIAIAAGQSSGQFTINTASVTSIQTAQITATSSNSVHATLTINPVVQCISALVLNASITDLLSGNGVLHPTVTLDGPAPAGGSQIALLRGGVNIGSVDIPEGESSGAVDLATPNLLSIVGSSVQASLNGCPAVHAPIVLGDPVTGTIAGVSLNPSTVFAGHAVTGSVTLTSPAGSNGVLVSLSTNNPSATILAPSVVVPAGQTSTTFPINTVNISSNPVVVSITATSGASSKSANLTISSSNPCVDGLQLTANITNLVSGQGVLNALVTLSGPAPEGGANVPLMIGATQVGQVVIPANQSTGLTQVTMANLPTLVGSAVRAVFGPCEDANATIAVSAPVLGNLVVPASLTLGESATARVILDSPAPAGGATVHLTKTPLGLVGNLLNALLGAVVIPSSVTVPEGQTEVTFGIGSSAIGGALGLLFPASADLQVDATLDSAFVSNSLTRILQCKK